jgi:hypothetical protein
MQKAAYLTSPPSTSTKSARDKRIDLLAVISSRMTEHLQPPIKDPNLIFIQHEFEFLALVPVASPAGEGGLLGVDQFGFGIGLGWGRDRRQGHVGQGVAVGLLEQLQVVRLGQQVLEVPVAGLHLVVDAL